ncbi:MAG: hypothetical protein JWM33_2383 [Caulobacteraceae bacterium]|nr:hypothetical protein [Caulobacteraceae bacterium]
MNYSPAVQPIPRPLYGQNLRKILTQTQWKKLRAAYLDERGCRCETCGKEEQESKRISAHEEWRYDSTQAPAVATLAEIKLSCWHCHAVEHFGAIGSMALGGELSAQAVDDTIAHFCRLNNVGPDAFEAHALEAFKQHDELSALEWRVDWGQFAPLVEARLDQLRAKATA